ncbi:photosynthetic complex putative assembly protein PuhB [Roseomonas sp. CECT 9278]|uniref:photosynthetic complex putative assembly protein PuhB n=1 Tax=Roseomonas sp. CECT 9278 TaxID=2845823 RepID=UPI001E3E762D|nr:photosynthetic complex putative assembly protein PuhB [Roseomonas sp. CECT 9278]CAH0241150.1 hypothetical protein ROS9278_02896 [Roseomonas sp. CECT 9278]
MSAAPTHPTVTEHGFEPVPGLPERLPDGETLLWQGRPGWRGLARGALHVRAIAAYFALVAGWQAASVATAGGNLFDMLAAAGVMMAIGAMPIAFLMAYAWMAARGAVYSITSRRVVMRVGVALPVTINLPFAMIDRAALSRRADGSGDLVLRLAGRQRASWIALWPHCRPWRVTRPEPMLRALPDAEAAAQILGRALAAAASMPVSPIAAAPRAAARAGAEAMA